MVDLFFANQMFISGSCKLTSLQLTPQLPRGLFAEPPLDSGGADDRDLPNRWANSEIEHHIFAYTNAGLWFHICCLN